MLDLEDFLEKCLAVPNYYKGLTFSNWVRILMYVRQNQKIAELS